MINARLTDTSSESKEDQERTASSRRLRVLVFTLVFPNRSQPLLGTFVFERVRHLAALADIEVAAPIPWHRDIRGETPLIETTPCFSVRHPRFWYLPKTMWTLRGMLLFLSAIGEVRRLRRSWDFDLIDAHFAYPDGFAAILLGMWFRRPVCITLRGTIISLSRRFLGRQACNWAIRHAERVIVVADNLAERARQGGVPEDRIATIVNGVDTERFRLVEAVEARRRLGLPEKGRLLVSVGHISPRKGFHRILRALPLILQSSPDIRLAIVGGRGAEKDNSAELHTLVARLGLSNHVLFAGPKPPEEVACWLAAADVFALASDFEGCPNVVLEAMACGRPIVATKVGHIARMVPSFAGILIEDPEDDISLAQAVLAALGRDWDRRRIREHVAAQSWEGVARRVAAQWELAAETFARRAPLGRSASSEPRVTVIVRNPET
jgi:glycosyltransferase involved in cell wall biosynthesis